VQLDMSEYMEKHNVSRLVGAPPGYIGYEEGGQLTEKIRRKPYSVVLLDEIEKAHPDVWNMLLQIMEEGRLTDNVGRTVDFKNTILIMTTNIGAETIVASDDMGAIWTKGLKKDSEASYQEMQKKLRGRMEKEFRPEFLNRLDEIIVFRQLTRDDLKKIVEMELAKVAKRLSEKGIKLTVTEEAKEYLIDKGSSTEYGARPLRRAIEQHLEDMLAEELLKGTFHGADALTVKITEENGEKKLAFESNAPAPAVVGKQ
jgi:ATP-dependent Clp protease ATP-binding subunit ClpC